MDFSLNSIDSQTVLVIAAIAVAVLAVRLLFRMLNVGLGSILTIVAIAVALQYFFHISPKQLWFEVSRLPKISFILPKDLAKAWRLTSSSL
jgi:heme/copper-type cytochrome/quinol oxidase subunit 4